ncbi:chromosome partitioning protein ParA [Wenjunlia vitaminophila]|uniref:Chromosome partitioning protein ParA n=1 Tax=Wenjunlia vitaminophila TaxID=76728 RepID=A0A0T6LUG6_WENVI|nr:DUF1015 domain-containing protein [Wenjunlia vitaminophila]KRV49670.1 chromosome partitioning protein ParA [Wenjunlia vitaminophila]
MTTTDKAERNTTGLSLRPFRGLRYDPDRVSSLAAVTSPPYDVVVRPEGVRHLQTADPHNVVRLILPTGEHPRDGHQLAARTLRQWQADGILVPDPEPALYVYEQRTDDTLQRGVIGGLALDGAVLPHENVMPGVVADRADLMRATAANLEPLLLAYRGSPGMATALAVERTAGHAPLFTTTTEDGVQHRLWAVTHPREIASITAELTGHQALIADGHHRWATYQRLRRDHPSPSPWDFGLVLLVDSARYPLRVRAIHRVVRHLPVPDALAALDGVFRVRPLPGPLDDALAELAVAAGRGNAFLLAGDGSYHLLTSPDPAALRDAVPAGPPESWRRLDATVLHRLLLDRVWGIPDSPDRVGYLHNATAAEQQAAQHKGCAVLMHPVEEDVVRELAEQGVMMPHKSTSFGPKPASGLVLRSLELDQVF